MTSAERTEKPIIRKNLNFKQQHLEFQVIPKYKWE